MRIIIVSNYPIPYGMAATTRMLAYAKGLVNNGNIVEMISLLPSGGGGPDSGVLHGVRYYYAYRRAKRKTRVGRVLDALCSMLLFVKRIREESKDEVDAFIVSSDYLITLSFIAVVNFIFRTPLFFIFDEYPRPIRGLLKSAIPKWKRIGYSLILRPYSGYLSMTKELLSFYQSIVYHPGITISTIIDVDRFKGLSIKTHKDNDPWVITYLGNMELSKDNVDLLIRAVAIVRQSFNIHLNLFGTPSKKDSQIIMSVIKKEKMEDFVSFGVVPYEEVPAVLSQAHLLVSSQPNTLRALGGFPTKVGEYLATGIPTLIADVGSTSQFFKDGQDMFFAKPESVTSFAAKIVFIFSNYNLALDVARRGKEKVISSFSADNAGKEMAFFINMQIA